MQKEGITLSEINIRLLQKIEELTLYSIQQNKEIQTLKNEGVNYEILRVKLDILQKEINNLKINNSNLK